MQSSLLNRRDQYRHLNDAFQAALEEAAVRASMVSGTASTAAFDHTEALTGRSEEPAPGLVEARRDATQPPVPNALTHLIGDEEEDRSGAGRGSSGARWPQWVAPTR